ncbi:MAG: ATP-dependent sacrificial sulfur transferase LarE [Candidatus Binatia bacterium]
MREDGLATDLTDKLTRLQQLVAGYGSALLAFSGGVDSALVLRVAHGVLDDRLTALTSVSPTNPEEDTAEAVTLAGTLGVRHVVVDSNELEIPAYAANPIDRCFLCKDRLYEICTAEARARGIAVIMDGVNVDDLGDYRPGLRAAHAFGIRHPLVEAELTKRDVRALSRLLGLATWDRPASPCLSSRFPYGTTITLAGLRKVAEAESALRRLGFRTLRVRFLGDHARVEIDRAELPRLEDPTVRAVAVAGVQAAGFAEVTIDPAGFRSGSLNVGVGARTDR